MSFVLNIASGWGFPVFVNQNTSIFNGIVYRVDNFALNIWQRVSNKYFVENEIGSSSIVKIYLIIVSHFLFSFFGPTISVQSSTFEYISYMADSSKILFFKLMLNLV